MKQALRFFLQLFFIFNLLFLVSSFNYFPDKVDESSILLKSRDSDTALSLYVSKIVNFSWIRGRTSWISSSKERLRNSRIDFDDYGNCTFIMPWDNSTTYRLKGDYWTDGDDVIHFLVSRRTSNYAGSGTQLLISGSIYTRGNNIYADLDYGSKANYYADVNDTQFFNTASKRFTAKVALN